MRLKRIWARARLHLVVSVLAVIFGADPWEASSAEISHGPLVGAVSPRSAKVWVRTDSAAHVRLQYSTDADFTASKASPTIVTVSGSDFTGKLSLSGLTPNTDYFYRVWLDGTVRPDVYHFQTSPPIGVPRTFTFAVLSDFQHSPAPVYARVARHDPAFVILLGDLDHSHPTSRTQMRAMHRRMRGRETGHGRDFARYLQPFPLYHVWDDHDFGMDNGDKTFTGKQDALKAFRDYFPTPTLPSANGIWHSFEYAHAEFFMLDLRSQRDPNTTPDGPDKSILGVEQKAWLKEVLLDSTARWKFIVSTVPFNPTSKPSDGWAAFRTEHAEIVDFIQEHGITGVIVLSGDLHTGGALDDGTTSGFAELSVPHANMKPTQCWTTERPGIWSEGLICGVGRPGYALITVEADSVTLQVKGSDGSSRLSLEVE